MLALAPSLRRFVPPCLAPATLAAATLLVAGAVLSLEPPGVPGGNEPWAFNHGLSIQLLRRMVEAGVALRITLYPSESTNKIQHVSRTKALSAFPPSGVYVIHDARRRAILPAEETNG